MGGSSGRAGGSCGPSTSATTAVRLSSAPRAIARSISCWQQAAGSLPVRSSTSSGSSRAFDSPSQQRRNRSPRLSWSRPSATWISFDRPRAWRMTFLRDDVRACSAVRVPGSDQGLHEALVPGDLLEEPAPQHVGARVSDLGDDRVRGVDDDGRQRRAHPAPRRRPGRADDLRVRGLDGREERAGGRFALRGRSKGLLELLDGEGARHLAGLRPSHSVRERQEEPTPRQPAEPGSPASVDDGSRVELHDPEGILVVLAHGPGIRARGHRHLSVHHHGLPSPA